MRRAARSSVSLARTSSATTTGVRFGSTNSGTFDWADPFHLDQRLSEDETTIRDQVRDFCQEKLMPRVQSANREERSGFSLSFLCPLSGRRLTGLMWRL